MKRSNLFVVTIAFKIFVAFGKLPELNPAFYVRNPGFLVVIAEMPDLGTVKFHGNVNEELKVGKQGNYHGKFTACDYDEGLIICFLNDDLQVYKKDVFYYWLEVEYQSQEYTTSVTTYPVP